MKNALFFDYFKDNNNRLNKCLKKCDGEESIECPRTFKDCSDLGGYDPSDVCK